MSIDLPAHGTVGRLVEPGLDTLRVELVVTGQHCELIILLELLQTNRTLSVKIIPENAGRQRLYEGLGCGRRRFISEEGGEGLVVPVSRGHKKSREVEKTVRTCPVCQRVTVVLVKVRTHITF